MTPEVTVVGVPWSASAGRAVSALQREMVGALLHAAVAQWCGTDGDAVVVGRLCPRCGSADHGRPYARLRAADPAAAGPGAARPAPHVSLAHAPGMSLLALSDGGPVGVDLVVAGSVDLPGHDDASWARLEAAAKATGEGIGDLRAASALDGRLVAPPALDGLLVEDLEVPAGYVGALALLPGPAQPASG